MAVFSNKPGEYSTSFGLLAVPASGLVYTQDESVTEELKGLGFTVTSSQERPTEDKTQEDKTEKKPAKNAPSGDANANPPPLPPAPVSAPAKDITAPEVVSPPRGVYPATAEAESGPGVKGK